MENLIDIGINLSNKQFNRDREDVIMRAIDSGVTQMIYTGTSVKASKEGLKYAKTYSGIVYSTAGMHPHDARHFVPSDINALRSLAKEKEVVAIGECGLDFNRKITPRPLQEECFEYQLELAKELNMPLFLHERDAHQRFVEIMDNHKDLIERSVVHCFTGNTEEVKDYISRGFYIGITGWICDNKRGKDLQEAVRHIPLDRILVETDGPYLAPKDLKPRPKDWRNEPMFLPHIVKAIAKHMNVSHEELAKASTDNTKRLFNI